jgi:hypothetical protein
MKYICVRSAVIIARPSVDYDLSSTRNCWRGGFATGSKLFEWIGSIIAIACLIEIVSNPNQVVRDIQNGPAPQLKEFNERLSHPVRRTRRPVIDRLSD